MTDTWREYGRWDELNLARIYNSIKSVFDFDAAECGTVKGKRF